MGRILFDKHLRKIASRRLTPMNEQMIDVSQWKPTLAEYQQLHQRGLALDRLGKLKRNPMRCYAISAGSG
jgi:hypothetical protein